MASRVVRRPARSKDGTERRARRPLRRAFRVGGRDVYIETMTRLRTPILPAAPAVALCLSAVLLAACAERPSARADDEVSGSPETASAAARTADTTEFAEMRHRMVERQVAGRGVRDTAVLRVMREVPRHRFVPPEQAPQEAAYNDHPLPIGHGQTISQPYIVAFMAEAARIEPGDRVLEIGTGSGYGAAVLAGLASEVYTIEIVPELAEQARGVLDELDYQNVHVRTGNGWLGWPEHAPFDAIVVTAAPDEVPPALVEQLAVGGTMVIPVGGLYQELRVLEKTPGGLEERAALPVRFVPMVGKPDTTG